MVGTVLAADKPFNGHRRMYYCRAVRILILIEWNVLVRLAGVASVFVCFDFNSMNYFDSVFVVVDDDCVL